MGAIQWGSPEGPPPTPGEQAKENAEEIPMHRIKINLFIKSKWMRVIYFSIGRLKFQTAFEALDIKEESNLQVNKLDNLSLWDQLYILPMQQLPPIPYLFLQKKTSIELVYLLFGLSRQQYNRF